MSFIPGLIGGSIGLRTAYTASGVALKPTWGQFTSKAFRSPLIQGGGFGLGYTTFSYGGYGLSNTWDPLGIHKPKYRRTTSKLGLPYGGYSYGMRGRYRSRYGRRYRSRYGYRRRSYYRRGYY